MPEVLRKSNFDTLSFSDNLNLDFNADEKHYDWAIWIHASINKHFEDRKGKYDLYIEGDERTLQDKAEFAELRVDGPFVLQPQKGLYYLDIEVNILLQTHMDHTDLYKDKRMLGTFLKAFQNVICVYKYGHDDSLLGELHLQRDLRETVDVNSYGIIKEDTRLLQTTIEGHYRLELENLNGSN
jgi:hypothetical protein